eukprot:3739756-Rhodomonas_salina.1
MRCGQVDARTEDRPRPVFRNEFACRGADRTTIDVNIVGGSILFGLGWALCGVCPGPGLIALMAPTALLSGSMMSAVAFNVCFVLGSALHKCVLKEALAKLSQKKA